MATEADMDRIELSSDLAEAFRLAGGLDERPQTLAEGFSAIEDRMNETGLTVSLEDMYQSKPTRHAVHLRDTVKHVPCVMDALIVALRSDTDPVDIYSDSPADGETIHFRVTGNELTVSPESAVVSFGLGLEESADAAFDSVKDKLNDPESSIPTVCSVINAFPDSEAYDRWAAGVTDAAVIELSVERLFSMSRQTERTYVEG